MFNDSVTNGAFYSSSSLKARATSQQTWVLMRRFHIGKISATKLTKLVDFLSQPLSCLRVHEPLQYHSICKANPLFNLWKFKTPSKPCDGFPLLCVTNNAPVFFVGSLEEAQIRSVQFLMFKVCDGVIPSSNLLQ